MNRRLPPVMNTKTGTGEKVVIELPKGDPDDLQKETERTCTHCGKKMRGKGRAKYCSDRCKNRAEYARRAAREDDDESDDEAQED